VGGESEPGTAAPRKRADARRNEATLLEAAATAFVESGVNVPVRDIAARAGVGVGTIYRHFPTRADLIVAVYRHQVEACAEAGPVLLAECDRPHRALACWIGMFVDFLVTKHGLADVLRSDDAAFQTLHAYFIDRLVPVCRQLLEASAAAGEIRPGQDAYELLRGVGNLCAGAGSDTRYNPRHLVELLIAGLRIQDRGERPGGTVAASLAKAGIGLRPATAADAEFCYQLHKAAMGEYVTAVWGWDEQVQRAFHERAFNPHRWQIITAGQAGIGMLDVEYRPGEIYLARIEIHPGHQGHGIGTRIISALLEEAESTGQDLVLDVLTVNHRAHALYRRLGLTEAGRHGDRGTKVTMRYAHHRE